MRRNQKFLKKFFQYKNPKTLEILNNFSACAIFFREGGEFSPIHPPDYATDALKKHFL